ncbi:MAG: putative drug exporter of the superfamily [Thermomicrobiales bacterium]|nr:putative drug exporter of the superfamily [Thermomicrobiales bacterium]
MSSLSLTARLARVSSHRPWRTIGIWIVLLVILGGLQGVLPMQSTSDVTLLNNPESDRGWDLLTQHGIRQERSGTETVIVRSATTTVADPAFQQTVRQVTDAIRADTKIVASATNYYEVNAQSPDGATGLVSADGKTTIIPVTLTGSLSDAVEHGADFLALIKGQRAAAPGFEVLTVGDASLNEEINKISEEDIARGESFGAGAAFLILLVVFGALVAAFVPIILAIISIGIAFGLAALVSQLGELSFFVTSMITMIGLAVGIDYSLFVVERYREERRRGAAKLDAIQIAGATSSRAVLFSGMTVVFALIGMFLVPNNIYRSLATGAILVVVVAVIASLTLIPAVLSLLGDKIDWPRRRTYDAAAAEKQFAYDHETIHSGVWGSITRVVMGHPVVSLVGAVALLVLCALPYLDFKPGLGGASSLPDDLESKAAYNILATEFSAGLVSPVEIVVEGPLEDPTVQQGMTDLVAKLGTTQTANDQPLFGPASVTTSPDGRVALISVPLKVAPDEAEGLDAIRRLREEIVPPIRSTMTDSQVLVTGVTANNVDFLEMRDTYTPIVFAFVLGLSFLLLMVVFRSIVVAAKAIVMNLLSVGAAYGLLVLVFQKGYGHDLFGFQTVEAIEAWLPLFLFSILFGLSMDYHVFLLSRIREHYDQTGRNRESVAVGLQATAKIITGAALIMVAVFAGFAAGRLVFLQQMGFGLGVAVLLDATIVRSILVPSAMALLKDWNWYLPSWLRWLPNVRVEGGVEPTPPPAGSSAAD